MLLPICRRLGPALLALLAAGPVRAQLCIRNESGREWRLRLAQRADLVEQLQVEDPTYATVQVRVTGGGLCVRGVLDRSRPGADQVRIPIPAGTAVVVRTVGRPVGWTVEALDLEDDEGRSGVCSLLIKRPFYLRHQSHADAWSVQLHEHLDKRAAFALLGVTQDRAYGLRIRMGSFREFPGGKPGGADLSPIQEGPSETGSPANPIESKPPAPVLPALPAPGRPPEASPGATAGPASCGSPRPGTLDGPLPVLPPFTPRPATLAGLFAPLPARPAAAVAAPRGAAAFRPKAAGGALARGEGRSASSSQAQPRLLPPLVPPDRRTLRSAAAEKD